jgi:hypothetical protein
MCKWFIIILVIIIVIISNPVPKVGDIFEDDKGRSFFFNGEKYTEIISREHHEELIIKYILKRGD